ncbi:yippee zinc-binding/DNA-binding /Mis18, centromere assembly-domain-containing protein [Stachybotrys elegans]|uniref:Yippee zinc-binding/DNA-binding /Mis18, centromere assembly-domain-containing protein n=1 Tax=Stachybotrys elegans TaxID=80388 RepID=A0A8K0T379_9HYPO|nr:yippee zinc-binding/DNA-binding /Mis18, centromere assembly-domain-containing protein [Stachybotrys elegans]
MVRESGISATKPIFPSYLLPSFSFALPARRSSDSSYSSSPGTSDASTTVTIPEGSPPTTHGTPKTRLTRTAADTLRCSSCSTEIAFTSQIVSKGFTGRHGRAILVAPPAGSQTLPNIRVGRNENRQLVTGWHVVADISCTICSSKLGWKYVDAREQGQKYKVGKFILETERVMTYREWDDMPVDEPEVMVDEYGPGRQPGEEIEFDSGDEEECEDIFAGTWDAEVVARRRSRTVEYPEYDLLATRVT